MGKNILKEMAKRAIRVELGLIDWDSALDYVLEDNPGEDRKLLKEELDKKLVIIETKLW